MRLYNAASCTPVSCSKATPTTGFLQASFLPLKNNTLGAGIRQGHGRGIQESNTKEFRLRPEIEERNEPHDDELSRASSSTLSTHTTLRDGRNFSAVEGMLRGRSVATFMPFPLTSRSALTVRAAVCEEKAPSEDGKTKNACGRTRLAHAPTETDPNQCKSGASAFEAVQRKGEVRTQHAVVPSEMGPWTHPRRAAPDLQQSVPTFKKYSVELSPSVATNPMSEAGSDFFHSPELTMTESSEDSAWLDFSVGDKDNPFHESDVHPFVRSTFQPIDGAPQPPRRAPVMIVKKRHPRTSVDCQVPLQTSKQRCHKSMSNPESTSPGKQKTTHLRLSQWSQHTNQTIHKESPSRSCGSRQRQPNMSPSDNHTLDTRRISEGSPKGDSSVVDSSSRVSKYTVMLRSGFSYHCVKETMERDNVDPTLLDFFSAAVASNGT